MAEKDYLTHFRPEEYLQMYYSSLHANSGTDLKGELETFSLDSFHAFYLKYYPQWDTESAKLLEFGGGPVVSQLISGAPYFKGIVFAAHTKEERREVQKWRDAEDGCHKWDDFFRYVVNTLEQKPESAWKERESLLRSRIKDIIACDIKNEAPLETGEHKEEFDVIQTSLCLEAACDTYDEYKVAVRKLSSTLKRGGFLVVVAIEEETFYYVGARKWYCLSLSLSQIKEAFEDTGLEIVEVKRLPAPLEIIQAPIVADFKAVLFLAAQKRFNSNIT